MIACVRVCIRESAEQQNFCGDGWRSSDIEEMRTATTTPVRLISSRRERR